LTAPEAGSVDPLEGVIMAAIERWIELHNKESVAELSGSDVNNIARRAQLAEAVRAAIRTAEAPGAPSQDTA
jgi:hypothetical protein